MISARKITVTGRVQGVGYRPFVYVTAHELGLTGSVMNGSGKVFIHAEGATRAIDELENALVHAAPPLALPTLALSEPAELSNATAFEILASDNSSEPEIHLPPDLYTCDDCVKELTEPAERRFGYPFINCTQCGPRYTIITAMPYDRPNTSMAGFPLCSDCRAEYESPRDRRFHAQPLACPVCGPGLEFVVVGAGLAGSHRRPAPTVIPDPIQLTVKALNAGKIVAIKGIGGYHLVCDATSDVAVQRLRERKRRPDKPLAVMFPLAGDDCLDAVRACLDLDEVTSNAIIDPARPIVLARKRSDSNLSPLLAPGLGELGAFLPYSPLHHQLLLAYGKPIVATSGNISGEPVITDNVEAQKRLARVTDAFLHHNRPIVRPADDPVIRPMAGAVRTIRLGRGIAPLERMLTGNLARPLLATGGHLKVTVALAWGDRVVISPHIGELDSPRSSDIFNSTIRDIQDIYDVNTQAIVCDLHPGYASSRWAEKQGLPLIRVQHHAAHASSLAGEHPDVENWLVFTWDGVGYGSDGSLWGGEALAGRPGDWNRVASFRTFKLVGGDKAGREPWRSAAALMWAEGREDHSPARPAPTVVPGHGVGTAQSVGAGLAGDVGAGHAREARAAHAREARAAQPVGAGLAGDVGAGHAREARTAQSVGAGLAGDVGAGHAREARAAQPVGAGLAGDAFELAHQAWTHDINTFETSAAGRLFDAAAAMVLGRKLSSFEGQGPMELEHIAIRGCEPITLPLKRDTAGILRSDWAPLLEILNDQSLPPPERAGIFHESMAQALVEQALEVRQSRDFDAVGLSGGVFQNRFLTERVVDKLQSQGFEVRLHREIPANDGGLCFGQIIELLGANSVGAGLAGDTGAE